MTATQTRIEKVGARLYFVDSPFAAKDRIKAIGAKWDGDRRQWWIGAAKKAEAEKLVGLLNGTTAVFERTEGSAQIAESIGLCKDTPAAVVADKLDDEGRGEEAARIRRGETAQEDPSSIRLTGKGRYKGREYYAGAVTRDGQKVRLLTLPDESGKYLDFWALCSEVEQTKKYSPREVWDGRRYSGKTVTKYTTLGSIADFIARQKAMSPARREEQEHRRAVSACGRRDCRRLTGGFCTDCHDEE